MLVRVVIIDPCQHLRGIIDAEAVGKSGDVQIVARLVPPYEQKSFNAQCLLGGGDRQRTSRWKCHLGCFERPGADHLAHASLNISQLAKDDLSWNHAVSDPVA